MPHENIFDQFDAPRNVFDQFDEPVAEELPVGTTLGGVGEAALTIGSQAVAEPLAGLAGLLAIPTGFIGGLVPGGESPLEKGQRFGAGAVEATRRGLTIEPFTQAGEVAIEKVGQVVEPVVKAVRTPVAGIAGLLQLPFGRIEGAAETIRRTREEGIGPTAGRFLQDIGAPPIVSAAAETIPTAIATVAGVKAPIRRVPKVPAPPVRPTVTTRGPAVSVGRPTLDRPVDVTPFEPPISAQKVVDDLRKGKPKNVAEAVLPDTKIVDSAQRLGVDLNPEHFSTNTAFQDVARALKTKPGSELQAVERQALVNLSNRADDLVTDIGGSLDKAAVSDDILLNTRTTIDDLQSRADVAYETVRETIPAATRVETQLIKEHLDTKLAELGGDKSLLTTAERKLLNLIEKGEKGKKLETIFRGTSTATTGRNFFSTSKDFAREFTQSGKASEVVSVKIPKDDIFNAPNVFAGNPKAVDAATKTARQQGKKAVRLSEGRGQPQSIFVFDDSILNGSITYAALDRVRRDIGDGFNKRSGPFKDDNNLTLREVYGVLSDTQNGVAEAFGIGELYANARNLIVKRKGVEDAAVELFGRNLTGSLVPKMRQAGAAVTKGDVAPLNKLIGALPEARRAEVAATILGDVFAGGSRQGGALGTGFVNGFAALNRNAVAKTALFKHLPPATRQTFDDIGRVMTGIVRANAKSLANPSGSAGPIIAALESGNMATKLYAAGTTVAGETALTTISGIPGLATTLRVITRQGKTPQIVKADKFLTSQPFKDAMQAAIRGDTARANNIAQNSPQFKAWATTLDENTAANIANTGFIGWLSGQDETTR